MPDNKGRNSLGQRLRVGLLFVVALSWPARAGADEPTAPAQTGDCSRVGVHELLLPAPTAVDEIWVSVADRSPKGSEAQVNVAVGPFDRVIRVFGKVSRGLRFSSPLRGERYLIEVGSTDKPWQRACIREIRLLRRGQVVASLPERPRVPAADR
jgi:hypothetical protein